MKDTIKEITDASTATHILSFSFCHYVTAEALNYFKHFRIVSRSLVVFERLPMDAG